PGARCTAGDGWRRGARIRRSRRSRGDAVACRSRAVRVPWLSLIIVSAATCTLIACAWFLRGDRRALVAAMIADQNRVAQALRDEVEERLVMMRSDLQLLAALVERGESEELEEFEREFDAVVAAA